MDEARQTAQRLWGRFRAWYAQAGRGMQIGVAVGALVVICVCCSVGVSALGKGGAGSTPTTGLAAHQTTATASKATATKPATKVATATATKEPQPTATAVSGVTTATLGGTEKAFISAYGPYAALPNSTTEYRDHRATIQGEDTAITVALTSNDDNMRVRYIKIQPGDSSSTWSNAQAQTIAKTFLPADAVYVKDKTVADFGTEHIYSSQLLAQSFPASAFTDADGNAVPAGTFYLACGDQVDGQGKCSLQLGE